MGEVRVLEVDPAVAEEAGHAPSGEAECAEVPSPGHREGPVGSGDVGAEERAEVHDVGLRHERKGSDDEHESDECGSPSPCPATVEIRWHPGQERSGLTPLGNRTAGPNPFHPGEGFRRTLWLTRLV